MNPDPDRQEKYACSIAYAENPYCLVVNGDNTDITSFEDLEGKLCINSPASAAGRIAQRYGATTADGDLTAAMEQLNTGRADGHINRCGRRGGVHGEPPRGQREDRRHL